MGQELVPIPCQICSMVQKYMKVQHALNMLSNVSGEKAVGKANTHLNMCHGTRVSTANPFYMYSILLGNIV